MFTCWSRERRRVADEFRLTLTCLAILRAQLTRSLTDEARQHLCAVIGEKAAQWRPTLPS